MPQLQPQVYRVGRNTVFLQPENSFPLSTKHGLNLCSAGCSVAQETLATRSPTGQNATSFLFGHFCLRVWSPDSPGGALELHLDGFEGATEEHVV